MVLFIFVCSVYVSFTENSEILEKYLDTDFGNRRIFIGEFRYYGDDNVISYSFDHRNLRWL